MERAMVNREVKRTVVRAMAATAMIFLVRLALRLFPVRRRMHVLFETRMSFIPPYRFAIRPSSMRTIRSASCAISSLCVIITMV